MKKTNLKEQATIHYSEFNGISDSLWSGIRGSFFKSVGLDIHSSRGSVTVNQKLSKDSGATITDLCKVGLAVSDGSRLWFSSTTGKIWREIAGVYTLVYTTVPTTGTASCSGAEEFNGNVYFATQNYLHYVPVANLATFSGVQLNWKAFSVGDASYHPMEVINANLFIGDNHVMAKVDSSNVFTGTGILDLVAPIRIKSIVAYDIDLVIGTTIDTTVGYSYIVEWDTIQTTWQFMELVWENGVNSLFWDGSTLLANAGQYGKLYYYSGHQLKPFKRIPGTWTPTSNGEILPNACAMWNGLCVFGFSADNGNPCDQAVYTLGSYDKDYTQVLNEDFPISSGNFSNIVIGSVVASGENLFVAWQDTGAGTQGVDKLDFSNKYTSAYLETMVITKDFDAETFTNFEKFYANYQSMPASTSISFQFYADWGTLTTPTNASQTDTVRQTVVQSESVDARVIRMRVNFTVSGNNAPVVESIGITRSN